MDEAERSVRRNISGIAITWIGTPFHDHGEVKGAGCDCATLLKRTYEEAGLIKPFKLDHYAAQHFLHSDEERYIAWVEKFAREIPQAEAKPGDVVLFKPRAAKCFCHGALIVEPGWPNIIHAHYAARCVRRDNGLRPRLGSPIVAMKFFSLFSADDAKKKRS